MILAVTFKKKKKEGIEDISQTVWRHVEFLYWIKRTFMHRNYFNMLPHVFSSRYINSIDIGIVSARENVLPSLAICVEVQGRV